MSVKTKQTIEVNGQELNSEFLDEQSMYFLQMIQEMEKEEADARKAVDIKVAARSGFTNALFSAYSAAVSKAAEVEAAATAAE